MANPAVNTDFQIATYAGYVGGGAGLVTLKSLGVPNPHPVWKDGVGIIKLGDNSSRTLGLPILLWHWGFISQASRDVLRTYCTGASAAVYIVTPTTNKIAGVSNAALTYLAQMWWPAPNSPEDPVTGRRLEFSIMFKQLVVQP